MELIYSRQFIRIIRMEAVLQAVESAEWTDDNFYIKAASASEHFFFQ